MLDYWTVNQEDLGMRTTCFGCEYKVAEYFTLFMKKEYTKYWLKT